jgi:hypothetical protein
MRKTLWSSVMVISHRRPPSAGVVHLDPLTDRSGQSATLVQCLIQKLILQQRVVPGQLTIHADRGPPYSEAQRKTIKYRTSFPSRFGSLEDALKRAQTAHSP